MRVSSGRVRFIWLVAFAVLAGNVVLASYNINVLIYNDELVARTRAAKEDGDDLVAEVVAAESGQRGYLLTADVQYLEPYRRALDRLPGRRRALRADLAGDPAQARRLTELEALLDRKLAEMASTLVALAGGDEGAARAIIKRGTGHALMRQILGVAAEIDRREDERLTERSMIAAEKYRATTLSNLVGGGLALGMVWLAYALIRGELGRRQRAEADARLTASALAVSQKATTDALAQLDAFLDQAPVGIAYYDQSLRYRRVNRVLAEVNRVPVADHLGRTTAEVLPDFPADLARDFERVRETGRPMLNRLVAYSPGAVNEAAVQELTIFPVPDGAGGTLGLGVFVQDVTLREQAQERLRESEDRFRTLADAVPLFVWTTRADGFHEYYNSRWYEYTGLTPTECLGHGWADPLHPDDAARSRATWRHSLQTGEPYDIEYRFKGASGEYRWFLGRARPVRSQATGEIVRWFGTCTDIEDQKRLTARLAQSESRFRTLAEAIPGFVWSATPDGALDYTNSRVAEYSGQPGDAALGTGWADLVHPDDYGRAAEVWGESLRTGGQYQAEFRLRRADGQYRWFLAQAAAIRDDAGEVEHWYGTTTDVDDFRSLQADMTRSEARFKSLAEAVPGFMYSATAGGAIDYMNARFEEYTGLTLAETYGAGWNDAMHPDELGPVMAAWHHATQTASRFQTEHRLRGKDGTYRWYITQALPSLDEAGAVERWYGTASDVHEFKTLTVRAELDAERFQLLTESIPQLIWNADAAGQVSYFNSRWRDYTGLAQAAAVRDWWAQVLHPDDIARVEDQWRDCVEATPEPRSWEARVRRAADGQFRWFLIAVVPLRRPDGTVDQWIGSLSDIEEQKRASARLERLVDQATASLRHSNEVLRAEVEERQRAEQRERAAAVELRRSNSELEKFAYVASHDLQEPLRKIQTFGDRLNTRFADVINEQGRDYIARMQSSATRMRVLINDLLTFSRVATRTQAFAPVELGAAVRDALSNLEVRLAESGGRVEAGDLPAVPGDAAQLAQLFQNLLGNALKFARPGAPPVVEVTAMPTANLHADCDPPAMADGVRVEVRDNGIGFEQVYADRIFDVFQRLHGRGSYEGTGIGLAICRKIIERHGGGIVARSEPDRGARFIFDLPANAPAGVNTTSTRSPGGPPDGVDG